MAISRRAFGIGLVAASAAATGGYVYLRQHPEIAGQLGEPRRLFGFAGGEKEGFLSNAHVRSVLERRFGLILDARRAGSVEMVRERALLDQKPQFLWPSSSVLVELARSSGVTTSPLSKFAARPANIKPEFDLVGSVETTRARPKRSETPSAVHPQAALSHL